MSRADVLDIDLRCEDHTIRASRYASAVFTDEDPERVAAVARLTWAYLRTEQYLGDSGWQAMTRWRPAPTRPDGSNPSRYARR